MKNRAKCKLCQDIIEVSNNDTVSCNCGEIFVEGTADMMRCGAKHWENFLRIDDEGNEIVPVIKDKAPPTRKELLEMLENMIKSIQNMPENAMTVSINHYDWLSLLILLEMLFSLGEDGGD